MITRILKAAVVVLAVASALPAQASDPAFKTFSKAGSFEDVFENLKDAIVRRGFVIDYVGQFNAMLLRTAKDTETVSDIGRTSPYRHAQFVQFCPARLTHEAVNASPLAIASCPIAFFVYELNYDPGKIQIGFRLPVPSASKRVTEVNDKIVALMQDISQEALK